MYRAQQVCEVAHVLKGIHNRAVDAAQEAEGSKQLCKGND